MKWAAFFLVAVIGIAHAENAVTNIATAYVEDFPAKVLALAKCSLIKLKCGRESLRVTSESLNTRYGVARFYRTTSISGLEIRYSFPKGHPERHSVGFMLITSPQFVLPLGLRVGDSEQKIELVLGVAPRHDGALVYVNLEQESEMRFLVEDGHVIEVSWDVYED